MADVPLDLPFGEQHTHLPLSAVIRAGERRRVSRPIPRNPRHGDRRRHAEDLREQIARLTSAYRARSPVLGVEPGLVMKITVNREIDPTEFERAGIRVLDMSDDLAVIAFADDPRMEAFEERRQRYEAGREDGDDSKAAPLESFFDAIEAAELWNPADCITDAAHILLAGADPNLALRLDVQCWCPEDRRQAEGFRDDVSRAVGDLGGRVLDSYLNERAGLSLLRIEIAARDVMTLALLDRIHRLDVLPSPSFGVEEITAYVVDALPAVLEPGHDAPLLAVIDSGIRSSHPLLAPAVHAVEALSENIADGEDRNGHGTHVASVALYGALEPLLGMPSIQPAGRLLSVRVLDDDNHFPDAQLWERELEQAIRYSAEQGARVVNLSLGDPRTPYRGSRPSPAAAIVDQLSREFGIVAVTTVGNVLPTEYPHDDSVVGSGYLTVLANEPRHRLLDPSPAALAITVGGLCPELHRGAGRRESARALPLGQPRWPSPATRPGPGIAGMVKPEVSAAAGNYTWDPELRRISEGVGIIGADGQSPERLLGQRVGTSHAAPHVSNVLLRTAAAYPAVTSNLLRALLLQSTQPIDIPPSGGKPRQEADLKRRFVGYGEPDVGRATHSTDHRAVLVAEAALTVDSVHIYRVPIPKSFFDSGGWRRVAVALAFDPLVRVTRLDYMSSRMSFALYRRIDLETVEQEYLRQLAAEHEDPDGTPEQSSSDSAGEDTADEEPDNAGPKPLRTFLVDLKPTGTTRALGANQLGSIQIAQRWNEEDGDEMLLVVRNTNQWDEPGAAQQYAVAVSLEREPGRTPVYAELAARLSVEVEIETVEAEITI